MSEVSASKTPSALIFGITGQDGSLLARHILSKGWSVHGASRSAVGHGGNLSRLGIYDKVMLHACDPVDFKSVVDVITRTEPAAIYDLGGQSSVGQSFEYPLSAMNSIAVATQNILEAIRQINPRIRFFNAASSDSFGNTPSSGADETTAFRPRSPYAAAKAYAFWSVATYREAFGLFAVSAILFNHESPLRQERFVTQKIVRAALQISRKELKGPLRLGNLDVRRDWGWASEYVDAMWLMMQLEEPSDFVIATGTSATLREFTAAAFAAFDLDWQEHVVSSPELMRPTDVTFSLGRPALAEERLGWRAQTRMPQLVHRLVADRLDDVMQGV